MRTSFPFFWITLYGAGSKFGHNLFSRFLLSRIQSPSTISLYPADRLVSVYSFCLSLARASLSRRSCCQWASAGLSLGMVIVRGLSLGRLLIKSSAGESPVEVWGVVR